MRMKTDVSTYSKTDIQLVNIVKQQVGLEKADIPDYPVLEILLSLTTTGI